VPTPSDGTVTSDGELALPFAPRRGAALQVLVFRALHPEYGPVVAGSALRAGPGGLSLRMDGSRALIEVAGLLAGHNLLLTLQERGLVLWESIAHVAWVAPLPDGTAIEIGLLADTRCPAVCLRRLRKA
jgi:hypothetical protein